MNSTIDTIIAEVLSFSPQARAFVAEKLIESLDSEQEVILSPAWKEEVRKRCREIDEGAVKLRDAEDVFARAYEGVRHEGVRHGILAFDAASCARVNADELGKKKKHGEKDFW